MRSRWPACLLDYALFRRDLGFGLKPRWAQTLRVGLPGLPGHRRRLASALLAELTHAAGDIAACSEGDHLRREVIARQDEWREAFFALLDTHRAAGLCVVGNAGTMIGSRLGAAIDDHGLVVRFNRFSGEHSLSADIGTRVDIWVVAPGFDGPPPAGVRWIVVTGPDMRFRRQDWSSLRPAYEVGARLLTVPLEPWRRLVAQLQAPPSAGLLFLEWLRAMRGSWEGVRVVGFGASPTPTVAYHLADPLHQPVERHNWPAERALLQRWHAEGLDLESR